MKNTLKLFVIIALAAVVGFSIAGCKKDEGGGGFSYDDSLDGTWTATDGTTLIINEDGVSGTSNVATTLHNYTLYLSMADLYPGYDGELTIADNEIRLSLSLDGNTLNDNELLYKYTLSGSTLTVKDKTNTTNVFIGTKSS